MFIPGMLLKLSAGRETSLISHKRERGRYASLNTLNFSNEWFHLKPLGLTIF
jgi:hypothetical protein